MYKNIALILSSFVFIFILAVLCNYFGFVRGYAAGTKNTNTWWIDKQSRNYEKPEVIKRDIFLQYNII